MLTRFEMQVPVDSHYLAENYILEFLFWVFRFAPQSLDCQFGKSATSVLKVEASWVGKVRPLLVSMDLYALI